MNAQELELEAASAQLAYELGAERMDPIEVARTVKELWGQLPPDYKRELGQHARQLFDLRGVYFARLMATVNALFGRNPAAWQQALLQNRAGALRQLALQAGRAAGIPPRNASQNPRGFSPAQVRTFHQRQLARGRVPGRNRAVPPYRELEYELEAAAHELENGEGFWTKVTPIPGLGNKEGHEIITRSAMSGLPLSAADQAALLLGVIRPDRGGASYWNFPGAALGSLGAAAQAAHSLRATPATSTAAALTAIQQKFAALYRTALGAPNRIAALEWIGEALHLLQDSFSAAHVDRVGGSGRIRTIRAFFIRIGWPPRSLAPHEHNAPSDDRDNVHTPSGALRPEASAAVTASGDLIAMALRHLGAPSSPVNLAELGVFISRHLS